MYDDWGNTRYSTLDRINRDNVRSLGGAWVVPTQSAARSVIVREGLMLMTSGADVIAMDPKTGTALWNRRVGNSGDKGVGYGERKVFVGAGLSVRALDAETI